MKSDWIESFKGARRNGQDDSNWAVKKDGGQFDQFTGATITPRAVVKATGVALDYFESHKNLLLSPANREKSYAE
jgi:electron transport complex protein RnfG